MSQITDAIQCPDCGFTLTPGSVVCPACHCLVHRERLSALAKLATDAEAAGNSSAALAHWREALDLLPPDTSQYQSLVQRANRLSQRIATSLPQARASATPKKGAVGRATGFLAATGMLLWKLKVVLLFALTKGKLLLLGLTKATTFLSMFLFFLFYWGAFGWVFALGVVISIYIHEMGHVDALRRYGFKATAPMFIPGFGAIVRLKQHPMNPVEDSRIGLAGPLWGMFAALGCLLIYLTTDAPIWAAIAHFGALINIFNLIPIGPLDGGRGLRGLSRNQAILVAAAIGAAWALTGEGMLLIVAIVAVIVALAKPRDQAPDRGTLALFVLIVAGLATTGHYAQAPTAF